VDQTAVEWDPPVARDGCEPLAVERRRVQSDVCRPGLDHSASAIPLDALDARADLKRDRPRRTPEVLVVLPEAEVDMVVDPLAEEPRPDQLAEGVADRHPVAGSDRRVDVQDPGDGVAAVDENEVVLVDRVRFRRTADRPGPDHLAGDGRPRAPVTGIEVDGTAGVVGRVR
jgi:hypothetical protein